MIAVTSPADVARRYIGVALVGALLVLLLYIAGASLLTRWTSARTEHQLQGARAEAQISRHEAQSADQGMTNATQTRDAVTEHTNTVRIVTETSAQRIEQNATRPPPTPSPTRSIDPDDLEPLPSDSLRELEAASASARATSGRLRRKTSSGTNP